MSATGRRKPRFQIAPTSNRTYGYTRVSTVRQSEEGVSLEDQERRIRGRCMELGVDLDALHVDRGISGSVPFSERPEGARLMRIVMPGDTIIATKLDRTFRDAEDCLATIRQLKARQVKLVLLDIGEATGDDPTARLFVQILACFAEWERNRIRERIREAKQHGKAAGLYLGGNLTFGYRTALQADGKTMLVEDPAEQATIVEIVRRRVLGESLRSIALQVGVTLRIVRNVCDRQGD